MRCDEVSSGMAYVLVLQLLRMHEGVDQPELLSQWEAGSIAACLQCNGVVKAGSGCASIPNVKHNRS